MTKTNDIPPFAKASDTSREAAISVRKSVPSTRSRVLNFIFACGSQGATCDEIEVALALSHQNASARVYELKGGNGSGRHPALITDSGHRRPTRSGRKAVVYVLSPKRRDGDE